MPKGICTLWGNSSWWLRVAHALKNYKLGVKNGKKSQTNCVLKSALCRGLSCPCWQCTAWCNNPNPWLSDNLISWNPHLTLNCVFGITLLQTNVCHCTNLTLMATHLYPNGQRHKNLYSHSLVWMCHQELWQVIDDIWHDSVPKAGFQLMCLYSMSQSQFSLSNIKQPGQGHSLCLQCPGFWGKQNTVHLQYEKPETRREIHVMFVFYITASLRFILL